MMPVKSEQPDINNESDLSDIEPMEHDMDDDLYEDANDLDFSQAARDVWLSRIPPSLWQQWSKMRDDEEIQLGTVRVEGPPSDIKRISLRLNPEVHENDTPQDYLLKRHNVRPDGTPFTVQNTFAFTEKDLPNHSNRADVMFQEMELHGRRSFLYEQMKREARKKDKPKKWIYNAKKAIPKSTSLAGKICDDFNCIPVDNEEYMRIQEKEVREQYEPTTKTKFIEKMPGLMRNTVAPLNTQESTFIHAAKPKKPKGQDGKMARMPQNELLDLIFDCFKRYRYWPFKALKAELQQPETYLKQTLEMIAHLVRTGSFAMTWELNPEAMEGHYENDMHQPEGIAPDTGYDVPSETEREEDTKFEDVF